MKQQQISQNFTFLSRLDRLKTESGLRWEEIAKSLGVTREHLYNYRKGKTEPPQQTIFKLAAAERDAGLAPPLAIQMEAAPTPEAKAEIVSQAMTVAELASLVPEGERLRIYHQVYDLKLVSMDIEMHGYFLDSEGLANVVESYLKNGETEDTIEDFAALAKSILRRHKECRKNWKAVLEGLKESIGLQSQTQQMGTMKQSQ